MKFTLNLKSLSYENVESVYFDAEEKAAFPDDANTSQIAEAYRDFDWFIRLC